MFEPMTLGTLEIPNRIVMAPLVLNYVDYPYKPTAQYAAILEERARGGVGLIITSHVKAERTIDPYPIGNMFPCIDNEYTLRDFAELTDAVHMHGAKIMPELSPGTGRYADIFKRDQWPVSASEVPLLIDPEIKTRALSYDEIQRLVEAYGQAAKRVEMAGFDGIEIHVFAGYLTDQFLNPVWNKRTDQYGGDLDNRMRFMTECIDSAKANVSSGFPLIARLSSVYGIDGIRSTEETITIAQRLEQLGILALHLAAGCYEAMEWLAPTIYDTQGCMIPYAHPIKEAVSIPVITEGRISDPAYAEQLLAEGKTDFVGLGRSLLADPHWPKKVREGRIDEIRKCIFCNECTNALFTFKHVKCAVNPALGREKTYRVMAAAKPKKVTVIGGGPGGMQVAALAASRGHEVTLYDKGAKLGGVLIPGSTPEFKASIRSLIDGLKAEITRAGVTIALGQEVTVETIEASKPDAVVVATGGKMTLPDILGVDGDNVVSAIDVLAGKVPVGQEVVVIGGGYVGCETGLYLAQNGKTVTILLRSASIAADAGWCENAVLLRLLPQHGVRWVTGVTYKEITRDGVVITDKGGNEQTFPAATVVLAVSLRADDQLYRDLQGKIPELYRVGDAREPRKIFDAMHEGSAIGLAI